MLRDPERQTEDWEEPIVADTERLADRECSKRAKQYTRQNRDPVEHVGTRPASKKAKKAFFCIFRS